MQSVIRFLLLWVAMSSLLSAGSAQSRFRLKSTAFGDKSAIPIEYTCQGEDVSPEFSWTDAPDGTKSFALVCVDPKTAQGELIHWMIYNIPSTVTELKKGIERKEKFEDGTSQGINDHKKIGYSGPCPPQNQHHSYVFTVFALDAVLELEPGASYAALKNAMRTHVLSQARWIGYYTRSK